MFSVIRTVSSKLSQQTMLIIWVILFVLLTPIGLHAQKSRGTASDSGGDQAQPSFSDFRGVRIGMTSEEARKKLGNPREKSNEQDFYVFNDTQAVQVMYDKKGSVAAISVDFMSGANGIPSPKEVLGADIEGKPDGSMFKMVRYPKAGYWVSYSRTAGDSPTITIMMQKLER